jgi:hypothetical protein
MVEAEPILKRQENQAAEERSRRIPFLLLPFFIKILLEPKAFLCMK